MEITIQDVYPMDKGTTGATGYDLGEEFIEYRMDHPETLGWKIGMIHSHHDMKSYFSGVDMDELDDNTEFHNYYLSLVVNNRKEMVAKVAFRGDINGYGCKKEDGEPWTLKLSNARQVMFTFDCEINAPVTLTTVPQEFLDRTNEIIKQDAQNKAKFVNALPKPYQTNPNYQGNLNLKGKDEHIPTFHQNPFNGHYPEDDEMDNMEAEMWNQSFSNQVTDKSLMSMSQRYEDFTRYILRLAEDNPPVGDSLENVLEEIEVSILNAHQLTAHATKITVMYPAMFEKYWDIFGEINTEIFLETTAEVLDLLEQYEGIFGIADPLIKSLESMTRKMLQDEKR